MLVKSEESWAQLENLGIRVDLLGGGVTHWGGHPPSPFANTQHHCLAQSRRQTMCFG